MPLAAYFRNVGAALFALLMIADFYLPTPPRVQGAAVYPPVIRIHSDRKWPEPVIFDTTQVVFAAVSPASWDRNPPPPPAAREIPTNDVDASAGVRDALALYSHGAASVEKARQPARKYAARGTRRKIVLAARQGQFVWLQVLMTITKTDSFPYVCSGQKQTSAGPEDMFVLPETGHRSPRPARPLRAQKQKCNSGN
jgi:hypothetical protein